MNESPPKQDPAPEHDVTGSPDSYLEIEIRDTHIGKGIFATRPYPPSAVIGEITGTLIEDEQYGSEYCFDVGDGQTMEPVSPFRFVNHCCEPNCEFDYFEAEDPPGSTSAKHVYLVALRSITAGEEFTIDYNWRKGVAIRCECGAKTCRGWVMTADDEDSDSPKITENSRSAQAD